MTHIQSAIDAIELAREAAPRDAHLWYVLYELYAAGGDGLLSLTCLERAVELAPGHPGWTRTLEWARANNRPQDALDPTVGFDVARLSTKPVSDPTAMLDAGAIAALALGDELDWMSRRGEHRSVLDRVDVEGGAGHSALTPAVLAAHLALAQEALESALGHAVRERDRDDLVWLLRRVMTMR